ncbi:MAG: EF-hand domain-containing protein [Planctomycetes bacterium]|nr:EF-hand domain-containing protein [Planctomycetota bacterium]
MTIVCACSTGRGTTTYDKPDGVANFICIRFQQIDLNQDGYIDYLEFHGLPISQRPDSEHIFVAIDSNQDGKVSRREADDYLRPMSKR